MVTDHLGNNYRSVKEMVDHYGINISTYNHRVKDFGWPLEKALTTPARSKSPRQKATPVKAQPVKATPKNPKSSKISTRQDKGTIKCLREVDKYNKPYTRFLFDDDTQFVDVYFLLGMIEHVLQQHDVESKYVEHLKDTFRYNKSKKYGGQDFTSLWANDITVSLPYLLKAFALVTGVSIPDFEIKNNVKY